MYIYFLWVFLAGISGFFFKVVDSLRTETGFRHHFQFIWDFFVKKSGME